MVIPNKKEHLHCIKIKSNGANLVFVASLMSHEPEFILYDLDHIIYRRC